MGKLAIVFAGRNGLDPSLFRTNILRIPEVSLRVREAQKIIDSVDLPRIDLYSHIASDDDIFSRNIRLKSLTAAIVQIGLFDRLSKQSQPRPEILAGPVNADSALATVIGRQTFEQMILRSPALETLKPSERLTVLSAAQPAPLLSGLSLAEYEAVIRQGDRFTATQGTTMDAAKLLNALVEENGVRTFVNIGPAGLVVREGLLSPDVEVLDSIDLDPMLSWFWSSIRPDTKAIAN